MDLWRFVVLGQWGLERGGMARSQKPIFYSGGPQHGAHGTVAASGSPRD